ncbi:hypothetical protein, partial [Saccharomonospora iraqiensis]|uniref:hypothetical protein n=1 Tax=Saccharomonospora iraqiensis TaxID=52698 RepID=UPI000491E807
RLHPRRDKLRRLRPLAPALLTATLPAARGVPAGTGLTGLDHLRLFGAVPERLLVGLGLLRRLYHLGRLGRTERTALL